MVDIVTFIEVVKDSWLFVPLDPDSDGYNEMIIEKLEVELDVMWTSVVIPEPLAITPFIPYQARFDYGVYLKLHKESVVTSRRYSVTRLTYD